MGKFIGNYDKDLSIEICETIPELNCHIIRGLQEPYNGTYYVKSYYGVSGFDGSVILPCIYKNVVYKGDGLFIVRDLNDLYYLMSADGHVYKEQGDVDYRRCHVIELSNGSKICTAERTDGSCFAIDPETGKFLFEGSAYDVQNKLLVVYTENGNYIYTKNDEKLNDKPISPFKYETIDNKFLIIKNDDKILVYNMENGEKFELDGKKVSSRKENFNDKDSNALFYLVENNFKFDLYDADFKKVFLKGVSYPIFHRDEKGNILFVETTITDANGNTVRNFCDKNFNMTLSTSERGYFRVLGDRIVKYDDNAKQISIFDHNFNPITSFNADFVLYPELGKNGEIIFSVNVGNTTYEYDDYIRDSRYYVVTRDGEISYFDSFKNFAESYDGLKKIADKYYKVDFINGLLVAGKQIIDGRHIENIEIPLDDDLNEIPLGRKMNYVSKDGDYIRAEDYNGKKFLFDFTGKMIVDGEKYDECYVSKGYISIKKDGKTGIIGLDGEEIAPCEYNNFYSTSKFSLEEGLFGTDVNNDFIELEKEDGTFDFYDVKNKKMIKIDGVKVACVYEEFDDIVCLKTSDDSAIIYDLKEGQEILSFPCNLRRLPNFKKLNDEIFYAIESDNSGNSYVVAINFKRKLAIIDDSAKGNVDAQFIPIGSDGKYFIYKLNEKCTIRDNFGNLVFNDTFKHYRIISDKFIYIELDHNNNDEEVGKILNIERLSEDAKETLDFTKVDGANFYKYKEYDGRYTFYKIVTPERGVSSDRYSQICENSCGRYLFSIDLDDRREHCGYFDENGNELFDVYFDLAYDYSEGLAVVLNSDNDNNYEVIDTDGNTVFEFDSTFILHHEGKFLNGYLVASNNYESYCIIDKNGVIVSMFDQLVTPIGNDLFVVDQDDSGGSSIIVDSNGKNVFGNAVFVRVNKCEELSGFYEALIKVGVNKIEEVIFDNKGNLFYIYESKYINIFRQQLDSIIDYAKKQIEMVPDTVVGDKIKAGILASTRFEIDSIKKDFEDFINTLRKEKGYSDITLKMKRTDTLSMVI